MVDFAREHNIFVVHDFAYADLYFDGYQPPSFLQVPGAKEIGVEFFTLSKSYDMPGWRVGFLCGNAEAIQALSRLKSYFDYGIFQPIQIAAIHALNGPQDYVEGVRQRYRRRRDVLIDGLDRAGWHIPKPKGDDVRVGRNPRRVPGDGLDEICRALAHRSQGICLSGNWFWGIWR